MIAQQALLAQHLAQAQRAARQTAARQPGQESELHDCTEHGGGKDDMDDPEQVANADAAEQEYRRQLALHCWAEYGSQRSSQWTRDEHEMMLRADEIFPTWGDSSEFVLDVHMLPAMIEAWHDSLRVFLISLASFFDHIAYLDEMGFCVPDTQIVEYRTTKNLPDDPTRLAQKLIRWGLSREQQLKWQEQRDAERDTRKLRHNLRVEFTPNHGPGRTTSQQDERRRSNIGGRDDRVGQTVIVRRQCACRSPTEAECRALHNWGVEAMIMEHSPTGDGRRFVLYIEQHQDAVIAALGPLFQGLTDDGHVVLLLGSSRIPNTGNGLIRLCWAHEFDGDNEKLDPTLCTTADFVSFDAWFNGLCTEDCEYLQPREDGMDEQNTEPGGGAGEDAPGGPPS